MPRKIGLNWFMPALANSSVGSACGTTLLLGTGVCPLVSKNSMKAALTRSPAFPYTLLSAPAEDIPQMHVFLNDRTQTTFSARPTSV